LECFRTITSGVVFPATPLFSFFALSDMISVNPLLMLPFGALLALLALAPLFFSDWWGRHYPKVTLGLALLVVAYYIVGLRAASHVAGVAHEYFSFIALVGSLFIVSGGIHINVKGEATPFSNVIFLLIGALTANVLGTTGASMLLIRPWLRSNKYRITGHHVVFFIFIVSNVGGCLTPVGDPPLFLGYLMGVPFSWVTVHCFPMWATGLGILLLMFYVVDRRNYIRAPKEVRSGQTGHEKWHFEGLGNIGFLALIFGAVFISEPPFLREALMIAAAIGSYYSTRKHVHEANHFSLGPIKEVAILFIGIFATMMPALDWLLANAGRLETAEPGIFYWGSGVLSSVLDNAPTYLCFMKAGIGRFVDPDVVHQVALLLHSHGSALTDAAVNHGEEINATLAMLQKHHAADIAMGHVSTDEIQVAYLLANAKLHIYIIAVSVGSVFFGANTYIGNGPNFMVKAIADHQKVHTPSFPAYVYRYTLPVMLPMLVIIWLLFFR
jgi:Na+/H+ antiporter NhaD/arsenite permease-like protein